MSINPALNKQKSESQRNKSIDEVYRLNSADAEKPRRLVGFFIFSVVMHTTS